MKKIEAVITELDGVLLSGNGVIKEDYLKTVSHLRDKGIRFMILTERHLNFVRPVLEALGQGTVTAVLSLGGAYLYDTEKETPWNVRRISPDYAKKFFAYTYGATFRVSLCTTRYPFYSKGDPRLWDKTTPYFKDGKPIFKHGEDFQYRDEFSRDMIQDILQMGVAKTPLSKLADFRKYFSDCCMRVEEGNDGTFSGDVQTAGTDRFSAMMDAAERFGFSPLKTVFVSNRLEDQSMTGEFLDVITMESVESTATGTVSEGTVPIDLTGALKKYI